MGITLVYLSVGPGFENSRALVFMKSKKSFTKVDPPPPKLDSFSRYFKSNACLNLISLGNIKNSKNFCVEDP